MSRWLAASLVLLLLVTAGAPAGAGTAGGTAASASEGIGLATQQGFDHTTFVITVYGNGSARWTFQYSRVLDNESEQEDFRAFAEEFNENETELYRNFRLRAERLTRAGTNATDREMNATGFERRAFVRTGATTDEGIVQMSFLWHGFAATDGDEVRVGDVFEGGLYLGPNQELRIERGPDLAFYEVNPEPDSPSLDSQQLSEVESATWVGERRFANQHPSVWLGPPGGGPGGGDAANLGLLPLLAVLLVLLLGGGAVVWRTGALDRSGDGAAPAASTADAEPEAGADGATEDGADAPTPTGEVAGQPAVPDEELLSDEDRVIRLLEEHGGRMKQVQIVDETGWSKSKVSMLLSDMEEDDQISKLRVGRENVISLKGHEPDAAKSPFEDE